jgi:hypothetical protein
MRHVGSLGCPTPNKVRVEQEGLHKLRAVLAQEFLQPEYGGENTPPSVAAQEVDGQAGRLELLD